ncbi:hypothetical protein RBSWK_05113 [Rhodopirellula baltica SWK14]|uniref:Uncharacterized protein n=1 Tax=Rhodopirellula baltica SWK14 TaxID=993516 RepID=L7CB24_RHOBT|nr:hypothetical protein [Rhodopirellula baltica]ELP30847.1 hypothetical protein RBSWK_05113 [Rhodopirellula baltica SWK14]
MTVAPSMQNRDWGNLHSTSGQSQLEECGPMTRDESGVEVFLGQSTFGHVGMNNQVHSRHRRPTSSPVACRPEWRKRPFEKCSRLAFWNA